MKTFSAVFFLALIFSVASVFAQTTLIKGRVIDAKSQSPVEYASIALFNSVDSVLVAGSVAKANGRFQIDKVAPVQLPA
ncbi:carboxypeptidase-like regulatory domain-containing protein [Mucilaginibacter humi]|uniref:carboxypeptidase-like regulatory domain-containing protein n=1 Tax=Mucilaginibacter humi TaxID=2732510 RepID=UPI001FE2771E|nr:carboxypeptidase-like regulatory domain-containing protein [Mucilaginibacter humi]